MKKVIFDSGAYFTMNAIEHTMAFEGCNYETALDINRDEAVINARSIADRINAIAPHGVIVSGGLSYRHFDNAGQAVEWLWQPHFDITIASDGDTITCEKADIYNAAPSVIYTIRPFMA